MHKKIQNIVKADLEKYRILIESDHAEYLNGNPEWASSLECCSYLLALYDISRPKRILDLGSGISSFCLRLFRAIRKRNTEIYSVDTSTAWLQRSIDFCLESGLDIDNFDIWENFIEDDPGKFDLIFMDIDNSTNRHTYFKQVFDKFCKSGTLIIFDDMHKNNILNPYKAFMKNLEYSEFDIHDLTLDDYGRFAKLIQIE